MMSWLILGLLVFFSAHSVRIFAEDWRTRFIEEKGKLTWRAIYSFFSLAGLALIIYGFGESRANPVFLWNPPLWTRHTALLLNYIAFLLLAAGNIPRNHFKSLLGHPMYAGIKVWAFAHLIANGRLGDMLLFGCFLVWSIAGFSAARRRDRKEGVMPTPGSFTGSLIVFIGGTAVYAVFVLYLHMILIGVPPY